MGRNIPVATQIELNHPIVAYPLFIACISATIATVLSLCGFFSRKKSPPTTKSQINENSDQDHIATQQPNHGGDAQEGTQTRDTNSTSISMVANLEADQNNDNSKTQSHSQHEKADFLKQPLPPPPTKRAASHHYRSHSTAAVASSSSSRGKLSSSMSQGNLLSSMSMRVLGNGLSSRQSSRREDHHHHNNNNDKKYDKKFKPEDSIWKKQIILGEKCRIPDDDDDAFLYDEKGNRIPTYHRRAPNSRTISRQASNVDKDAIPI